MRIPILIGALVLPSLIAALAAAQPRFRNVTAESGFLSIRGYGGHGIQVADIDGDGLLDVYVTHIFDPKQNRPDLLFRNLGGSPPRFEEIGLAAGVADEGFFPVTLEDGAVEEYSDESHAAVFADFDNDGDLDLFNGHTWNGHHRLYRNDGGARFVDISDSAGIDQRDLGPRGVGSADLDGNGYLDIVVSAWAGHIPNVYMNQGGLRFERIRLPGDADEKFANQGITIVDVNGDRRPDMALSAFEYVDAGSGLGALQLLELDSDRFVERTGFAGLAYEKTTSDYRGTNGFSFQDIDNDADLDLVITGYHGSKLYRNKGEGRFQLDRRFEGVHYTGAFGDVDLDSDLDFYIAGDTGIYINDGAGGFTFQDGIGLDGIGLDARSAVFADMDGDGDLDLLIASKQGPNTFFVNEAAPGGGWLKVALTAPNGEKGAVGAEVALYRGGALVGYRVVQTATGYCSQDPSLLHFGVDPAGTYDLRVTFKDGTVATRTGLAPRQVVDVRGN
ncbi:MAG TPA: CRTAC1 family protein [Vicinamibacteria bacterium]